MRLPLLIMLLCLNTPAMGGPKRECELAFRALVDSKVNRVFAEPLGATERGRVTEKVMRQFFPGSLDLARLGSDGLDGRDRWKLISGLLLEDPPHFSHADRKSVLSDVHRTLVKTAHYFEDGHLLAQIEAAEPKRGERLLAYLYRMSGITRRTFSPHEALLYRGEVPAVRLYLSELARYYPREFERMVRDYKETGTLPEPFFLHYTLRAWEGWLGLLPLPGIGYMPLETSRTAWVARIAVLVVLFVLTREMFPPPSGGP